jgi:hypothetical protein
MAQAMDPVAGGAALAEDLVPIMLDHVCVVMAGLVLACPGHPRFSRCSTDKTWMPATSAGMTLETLFQRNSL